MFRVSQNDLIGDEGTIEGVREIVRQQPLGRYHIEEISVDPLSSGHTAHRWGIAISNPDGSVELEPDPWDR
jgi:hypothetical protein